MLNKYLLNELAALLIYLFIQKYLLNDYHVLGAKIQIGSMVIYVKKQNTGIEMGAGWLCYFEELGDAYDVWAEIV